MMRLRLNITDKKKRTADQRRRAAMGTPAIIVLLALTGCSDSYTINPVTNTTPHVSLSVVPLPTSITEIQLPWWTADGSRIVFSARSTDFEGMQIASVAPDGSDFQCLTCAIAPGVPPLMKPIAFDDGRRVLIRVGNQTPFTNGTHAVLECSPSVVQCDDPELVPIDVPEDPLIIQPQREFRVAPGGNRVGLTQMRANRRGDPTYVSIVAGLRRAGDRYVLDEPRAVSDRGELKQFSPDGRTVYVSEFVEGPEAGNGDVVAIDLTTGDGTRLTTFPDYDEPVEPSPVSEWFTVGSARGAAIFQPLAQVRRPNVIGAALSPLALYLFNTYRDELLEPWLITAQGEANGEMGVLLNPGSIEAGWEGRMIPNWSPDGTQVVFWEAASESTPGSADAGSRLVVVTVDGLYPSGERPLPTTPDLGWAPLLAGYAPGGPYIPESRNGNSSGRMEVTVTSDVALTIEVAYNGFSDDGKWILDGTERIVNAGGPTGSVEYEANVEVTGSHDGYLLATGVQGNASGGFTGRIESEVDGSLTVLDFDAGAR
jgi:hypothetical protein